LRSILPIDDAFLPVRRKRVEKEPYNTLLGIDEDGKKENFTLWMSTLNVVRDFFRNPYFLSPFIMNIPLRHYYFPSF